MQRFFFFWLLAAALAAAGINCANAGMIPPIASKWALERAEQNAQAAKRERTVLDRAIRTGSGVSVRDIREHGVLGGPNSEARKFDKLLRPSGLESWVKERRKENEQAAKREKTELERQIRKDTGISIRDIKDHGVLGGPNSEARKVARFFGFK